MFTLDELT